MADEKKSLLSDKAKDIFKLELIKKLLIPGILILLSGGYWLLLSLSKYLVGTMDKGILAHILTIEALIIVSAIAFIITLLVSIKKEREKVKKTDPLKEYDFDQHSGILTHKTNGYNYCPSCFQKKIQSLMREQDNGWMCLNKDCKEFYHKAGHSAFDGAKTVSRRNRLDFTGY